MIENYLKSDVYPVIAIGGNAVHIPFHTTWSHEKIDHKVEHKNFKAFEKITAKELHYIYATNVFVPFQLIQKLLPVLGKKNKSHIINISSMGGIQGISKFPGLSAYSSSKAALAGLTECLAEEFKDKKNISINCLALGAVQTEMLAKAFPGYKAPLQPKQMANFIVDFALTGHQYFNGKIIPVSSTTP